MPSKSCGTGGRINSVPSKSCEELSSRTTRWLGFNLGRRQRRPIARASTLVDDESRYATAYEAAISLPNAKNNLAGLLEKSGDYDRAEALYAECCTQSPEDYDFAVNRACCARQRGAEDAEALFADAAKLCERPYACAFNLASSRLRRWRHPDGASRAKEASSPTRTRTRPTTRGSSCGRSSRRGAIAGRRERRSARRTGGDLRLFVCLCLWRRRRRAAAYLIAPGVHRSAASAKRVWLFHFLESGRRRSCRASVRCSGRRRMTRALQTIPQEPEADIGRDIPHGSLFPFALWLPLGLAEIISRLLIYWLRLDYICVLLCSGVDRGLVPLYVPTTPTRASHDAPDAERGGRWTKRQDDRRHRRRRRAAKRSKIESIPAHLDAPRPARGVRRRVRACARYGAGVLAALARGDAGGPLQRGAKSRGRCRRAPRSAERGRPRRRR